MKSRPVRNAIFIICVHLPSAVEDSFSTNVFPPGDDINSVLMKVVEKVKTLKKIWFDPIEYGLSTSPDDTALASDSLIRDIWKEKNDDVLELYLVKREFPLDDSIFYNESRETTTTTTTTTPITTTATTTPTKPRTTRTRTPTPTTSKTTPKTTPITTPTTTRRRRTRLARTPTRAPTTTTTTPTTTTATITIPTTPITTITTITAIPSKNPVMRGSSSNDSDIETDFDLMNPPMLTPLQKEAQRVLLELLTHV